MCTKHYFSAFVHGNRLNRCCKGGIAILVVELTATKTFNCLDGPSVRPHPHNTGLADITKVPGWTRGETTSLFTAGRSLDFRMDELI